MHCGGIKQPWPIARTPGAPVHEALPAGWMVEPPTYDPDVPGWSVAEGEAGGNHGGSRHPLSVCPPVTITMSRMPTIAASVSRMEMGVIATHFAFISC